MFGELNLSIALFFIVYLYSLTHKIRNLQGYIVIFSKAMKTTFFRAVHNFSVVRLTTCARYSPLQSCVKWEWISTACKGPVDVLSVQFCTRASI